MIEHSGIKPNINYESLNPQRNDYYSKKNNIHQNINMDRQAQNLEQLQNNIAIMDYKLFSENYKTSKELSYNNDINNKMNNRENIPTILVNNQFAKTN